MRPVLASVLAVLLVGSPFAGAAPQAPPGQASLAVIHAPVTCMIAGTNPQIEAGLAPDAQVQAGRVYFKSALGTAFYYVLMAPEAGQFAGVLPKPRSGAGPVTYYVEGVAKDFSQSQSPEVQAVVVEKKEDCGDKPLAKLGPANPVQVFSVGGGTAMPAGFSGVSGVVAAAGGGSFFTSTAGIITAAAAAAGIATVIIVATTGGENPPVSPSQ
jgi:hypothetical protein